MTVKLDSKAHDWVAEKVDDPVFGARLLKRFLQRNPETKLARARMSCEVAEGTEITLTVEKDELTPVASTAATNR